MIYLERPKDFIVKFEAVSAIIRFDNKFLILKRLNHKPQGGKWGLPTGKIENGELEFEAMIREIKEETGLSVRDEELNFYKSVYVRSDGIDFILHIYSVDLESLPEINANTDEHSEYLWITFEESLEKDMVDHQTIKLFFQGQI